MKLAIEKSGTGIEKSGTGIEKSGTGIEKSGTGMRFSRPSLRPSLWLLALLLTAGAPAVQADEPSLLLSRSGSDVQISIHTDQGIFAGSVSTAPDQTFVQLDLRVALGPPSSSDKFNPDCGSSDLMTHGSGTGSVLPCRSQLQRWGQAEIVFDSEGAFVLVQKDSPEGAIEVLTHFQANSKTASQLSSSDSNERPNRWLTRN